jgi:choline dehydrogenase-like flavoprotein
VLTVYEPDVCVIGSGVAGALVANACAERGATVLVLEAGPRLERSDRPRQVQRHMLGYNPWPTNTERDVYVNSSAFEYRLNEMRLRAVGGSTLHWTGVCQRLLESDFATQSRFGYGVDWPISYAELEPFYGRAERELGVSGESAPEGPPRSTPFPMAAFPDGYGDELWRRAAARLGITIHRAAYARNNQVSHDGRPPCATYATCTICPVGAQYSADWHILRAERTGRCTVLPETPARRIEVDTRSSRSLVRAERWDGGAVDVRARQVVIAAHAIETTRLLLMSGLGNADHLGRYLMEHWEVSGRGLAAERDHPHRIGFPILNSFQYYDGAARGERGALRVVFRDLVNPHDQFGYSQLWGAAMARFDCETFGRWRSIEVSTEHAPHRDSRVTLNRDVTDPFGDPAPDVHFATSALDQRTQADAHRVMQEIFDAAMLSDVTMGGQVFAAAHHMGTCRMSERPDDGVVDRDLRVHGTTNLHVAGSAVFPTGGATTPTLTIAALSLRLADRVMRLLSGS